MEGGRGGGRRSAREGGRSRTWMRSIPLQRLFDTRKGGWQ